jgi:hypothetical protein
MQTSPKVVEESEADVGEVFKAVLKVLASLLTTVDDASPIHGRDRCWVRCTQGPVDLLQDLAKSYLPRSRRGIPPSASSPSEEGERNEASA